LNIYLTPLKHPEKSSIFLGTRLIPLSIIGRCILSMRGKGIKRERLSSSQMPLTGKRLEA